MTITFFELARITKSDIRTIKYLQKHRMISSNCKCCDTIMYYNNINEMWVCSMCERAIGIRNNSFYECSTLSLQQALQLTYYWFRQFSASDASFDLQLSVAVVEDFYMNCRRVCVLKMSTTNVYHGKSAYYIEMVWRHHYYSNEGFHVFLSHVAECYDVNRAAKTSINHRRSGSSEVSRSVSFSDESPTITTTAKGATSTISH